MGWAEDRLACRNQDSSANLADFADRFFKIELKPDFKEESELKNKAFIFFFFPFRAEFKTLPDLKQWGFLWHQFHFEVQILEKAHQFHRVYRHKQSWLVSKHHDVGMVNATNSYMVCWFVFLSMGEKLVTLKARNNQHQKV